MKNLNLFVTFLFLILFILCTSCLPNDNVSASCYQSDPLDELPWLKKVVDDFDQPKSGPYILSLVEYKNEPYFVMASPVFSTPMNYIFNCQGKSIVQLGIDYKKFTDNDRFIKVIKRKD